MSKLIFKGVLFDLDGTLLDTANDLGETLNAILSKYQQPLVARADYRPIASDGAKGLLELGFGQKLIDYDYETLRQEFLAHYEQHIAVHTELYSGINEVINFLDQNNIPWGIVTNKPIDLTQKLLPHFEQLSSAKSVLGGDSLAQRKPHPAPLIAAANEIAIAPEHCIYVGDAPRDISAGNAADMFSVVANWGYIPTSENVNSWQASLVINSPLEIIELFNNC
ncbi:HAD family hydrolase [Colwellia sp. MEBiC06753]